MKAKYTQRVDNEVFVIPLNELYRLRCCDCGLVHDVVFVYENGELNMVSRRNSRATAASRQKKKYVATPQRQPLTDEQREDIICINCKRDSSRDDCERVARAIEAAHNIREKK